jgi:Zn-dependent protease
MVGLVAAAGVFLWTRPDTSITTPTRLGIFAFVALGWTVSLCIHEFDHAVVAWHAGDRSVAERGYLTLDPRRYMNRQLSIVLPIIIVLVGGIGLPGGAVMIDRRLPRGARSMVALIGPMSNAVMAVICALPLELHWVGPQKHLVIAEALAFLTLLEVAVTALNSLPIPGLDGFGVISPYLPDETVRSLMPLANYVFLGLFVLLLYSASASSGFFNLCFHIMSDLGVSRDLAADGQLLFTFWRHV